MVPSHKRQPNVRLLYPGYCSSTDATSTGHRFVLLASLCGVGRRHHTVMGTDAPEIGQASAMSATVGERGVSLSAWVLLRWPYSTGSDCKSHDCLPARSVGTPQMCDTDSPIASPFQCNVRFGPQGTLCTAANCGFVSNQVIFLPHRSRSNTSTAMLLRLLRLFVFAAAPVILVASPARAAAEKVPYTGDAKPGTIVIQSEERRLYLVTGKDQARKYPVGVGRSGKQWFGTTRIASKHIKPAWKPPVSLRGKRSPDFYIKSGSPKNPMGAAALVLADSELAIHGTNNPGSIGGFVSAGCIRMHNKDIMDLYGRVNVGTRVVFVK